MADKKYDNSGTLYVNDRKESDNHPDRTGSAMINGVEYWVNAWIKEGAKGKFMSISFRPKDASASPNKPAPRQTRADDDF